MTAKSTAECTNTDYKTTNAGVDPAIGGPGGRLPLWAALSEKTNEIWSVDFQENH